ncbi:MAG: DNA polymerase III subunit epsilon [Nevskia sp.]|nr:DNA polymerase III subunit epsilon [Nevskia sp.]
MSAERQIILDTETTGLEVTEGHRVIEIGCVEIKNRRVTGNNFHHYLNPDRAIDAGALEVHGISAEFLADKPRFGDVAASLLDYLRGAELVIHNAAFDVGFIDMELDKAGRPERLGQICGVVDTVSMARRLHPGQKASLDALCKRYGVDNSNRDLHGALLDARLLADVYLAMTGGQSALILEREAGGADQGRDILGNLRQLIEAPAVPLRVIRAAEDELAAHRERLAGIAKKSGKLLWPGEVPA